MRKPLFIARQGRRPSGLLGHVVARVMAKETAAENDVALELLQVEADDTVLEIGSGHGHTLAKAALMAHRGRLSGVDFSPLMVRHAGHRHRRMINDGRLEFRLGSSDRLPYADLSFDKAITVHTIYFWNEPLNDLREIGRVLKPGGQFVLGFRPAEDSGFGKSFPTEVYHIRPAGEVIGLLGEAGFAVSSVEERQFGARRMTFAIATPGAQPGANG